MTKTKLPEEAAEAFVKSRVVYLVGIDHQIVATGESIDDVPKWVEQEMETAYGIGFEAGYARAREDLLDVQIEIKEYFERQPTRDCQDITPRTMAMLLRKVLEIQYILPEKPHDKD